MDKLIIKNFGPIKDITIDVKDINIFIGPTASGKSVVAKLIVIFTSPFFVQYGLSNLNSFTVLLKQYNINYGLTSDTEIEYITHHCSWQIKHRQLRSDNKFRDEVNDVITFDRLHFSPYNLLSDDENSSFITNLLLEINVAKNTYNDDDYIRKKEQLIVESYNRSKQNLTLLHPVYFPTERILVSAIADTLFELLKYNIALPESIKDFGAKFEVARKKINALDVPFLQAAYKYKDRNNFIILSQGEKIKLETASSGFQSCIPLMIVLEYFSNVKKIIDYCYVIEEPELSLYPTMQKSLTEFIMSKVNHTNDRMVITTHSPYILTSIDNLIQASNAFKKHPELKAEIINTVPENLWVDYDKVSCYYFEGGYCRSTVDDENQSIGASNIDDVSNQLGETFDRLLDIKYHA